MKSFVNHQWTKKTHPVTPNIEYDNTIHKVNQPQILSSSITNVDQINKLNKEEKYLLSILAQKSEIERNLILARLQAINEEQKKLSINLFPMDKLQSNSLKVPSSFENLNMVRTSVFQNQGFYNSQSSNNLLNNKNNFSQIHLSSPHFVQNNNGNVQSFTNKEVPQQTHFKNFYFNPHSKDIQNSHLLQHSNSNVLIKPQTNLINLPQFVQTPQIIQNSQFNQTNKFVQNPQFIENELKGFQINNFNQSNNSNMTNINSNTISEAEYLKIREKDPNIKFISSSRNLKINSSALPQNLFQSERNISDKDAFLKDSLLKQKNTNKKTSIPSSIMISTPINESKKMLETDLSIKNLNQRGDIKSEIQNYIKENNKANLPDLKLVEECVNHKPIINLGENVGNYKPDHKLNKNNLISEKDDLEVKSEENHEYSNQIPDYQMYKDQPLDYNNDDLNLMHMSGDYNGIEQKNIEFDAEIEEKFSKVLENMTEEQQIMYIEQLQTMNDEQQILYMKYILDQNLEYNDVSDNNEVDGTENIEETDGDFENYVKNQNKLLEADYLNNENNFRNMEDKEGNEHDQDEGNSKEDENENDIEETEEQNDNHNEETEEKNENQNEETEEQYHNPNEEIDEQYQNNDSESYKLEILKENQNEENDFEDILKQKLEDLLKEEKSKLALEHQSREKELEHQSELLRRNQEALIKQQELFKKQKEELQREREEILKQKKEFEEKNNQINIQRQKIQVNLNTSENSVKRNEEIIHSKSISNNHRESNQNDFEGNENIITNINDSKQIISNKNLINFRSSEKDQNTYLKTLNNSENNQGISTPNFNQSETSKEIKIINNRTLSKSEREEVIRELEIKFENLNQVLNTTEKTHANYQTYSNIKEKLLTDIINQKMLLDEYVHNINYLNDNKNSDTNRKFSISSNLNKFAYSESLNKSDNTLKEESLSLNNGFFQKYNSQEKVPETPREEGLSSSNSLGINEDQSKVGKSNDERKSSLIKRITLSDYSSILKKK